MKNPLESLLNHLEGVAGERPDFEQADGIGDKLPLFLRERYSFYRGRMLGQKVLLALESSDWESGSPGEYGNQLERLRAELGEEVVLVLGAITSYARNRLVRAGVPFIVPGTQVFLPGRLVDLRERFPTDRSNPSGRLSAAAQLLLLCHLQKGGLAGLPLSEIAVTLGYTTPVISKAKDELEGAGLCEVKRAGRSLTLQFTEVKADLWQQALPRLGSPVRKTRWVRWENPGYPAVAAGLTALSKRTMIEDDRLPTFALASKVVTKNLEAGIFNGCRDAHEADLQLEVWVYNPVLLARDEMVDSLSLYLSLRDVADERVQGELDHMMEELKWSEG